MVLDWPRIQDSITKQFQNDATVEVTLYTDEARTTEVAGQVWPTTMDYVAASNGLYRAILSHELVVSSGDTLYGVGTATAAGSGYVLEQTIIISVVDNIT
jgi:hypothetical protein